MVTQRVAEVVEKSEEQQCVWSPTELQARQWIGVMRFWKHHGRGWQVIGWGHVPTPEERQSTGSRQPGRV